MDLTTENGNNTVIVNATGRLDYASAATFQDRLVAVIRGAELHMNAVVIDCSALEYVSSAGLRSLVVGVREARKREMRFCVCGLAPQVEEVFAVTKVGRIMEIRANRTAALDEYETQ